MFIRTENRRLSVDSPAKLNLFLEVVGKRSDGYHELETVMAEVNWCDTITAAATKDETVSLTVDTVCEGVLSADEDNLVLRAARLLQSETDTRCGAAIHLVKRVPWRSGLGGGSSNAAGTLLLLNRLWKLNLDWSDLHNLAAKSGSDVNFFISCAQHGTRAAMCTGRGETVQPLFDLPPLWFVVSLPDSAGLSTPAVFSELVLPTAPTSTAGLVAAWRSGSVARLRERLFNRLAEPATRLDPAVAELIARYENITGRAGILTGSGSAVFALFAHRREAIRAASRLRLRGFPNARAVQTV